MHDFTMYCIYSCKMQYSISRVVAKIAILASLFSEMHRYLMHFPIYNCIFQIYFCELKQKMLRPPAHTSYNIHSIGYKPKQKVKACCEYPYHFIRSYFYHKKWITKKKKNCIMYLHIIIFIVLCLNIFVSTLFICVPLGLLYQPIAYNSTNNMGLSMVLSPKSMKPCYMTEQSDISLITKLIWVVSYITLRMFM